MGRRLRHLPKPSLIAVSTRTVQARFLCRPSRELNEIVGGCLGRALELYPLELVAATFLSNHYHLLVFAQNHLQLSSFMRHLNGNLAREIARLAGWQDKVWSRRFDPVIVDDDPEVQRRQLKYLLAQGVKEGLVESPLDWPGVHTAQQLVAGKPLVGYWFDRTREWAARRRRETFDTYAYATRYETALSPLPCWRHLLPEEHREKAVRLVREIEDEAAAERARSQVTVLGRQAVLDQDPHHRPERANKSPRPLFHAGSRESLREFLQGYREFMAHYRLAAARLQTDDRRAEFPEGSFPPALPFVGEMPESPLPPPVREGPAIDARGRKVIGKGTCGVVRIGTFGASSVSPRTLPSLRERPATEARSRGQPP